MMSSSRSAFDGLARLSLPLIALLFVSAYSDAAQPPSPRAATVRPSASVAPVGVQLYSFREAFKTDVPGTLKRIHDLGFRDVELAGTYGLTAARFRQLLDSVGLHASSMHVGYEQFRDSLPQVLADAKTLGVRYVGTAWIPHPDGPISVPLAREAAVNFNKWGRAARTRGFQFFYHVHGYEFVRGDKGVLPMDVLMRETDPTAVKYEMDVFWATLPGNNPVALLKKYSGRWRLMHLKDMKKGVATNVMTGSANPDSAEVPVGTGQIDYRAVLRAAKQIGVVKFYLEDETKDPFATVPQSVNWLRTVKF
ncbi:MAG TPA: sugar phosphate isomerase/epimerase [Gemmatimonadaceae bacterium]|nr:sugar phosphate isomerase/epimerase [Gemmatimonadaceae bacterium]